MESKHASIALTLNFRIRLMMIRGALLQHYLFSVSVSNIYFTDGFVLIVLLPFDTFVFFSLHFHLVGLLVVLTVYKI